MKPDKLIVDLNKLKVVEKRMVSIFIVENVRKVGNGISTSCLTGKYLM